MKNRIINGKSFETMKEELKVMDEILASCDRYEEVKMQLSKNGYVMDEYSFAYNGNTVFMLKAVDGDTLLKTIDVDYSTDGSCLIDCKLNGHSIKWFITQVRFEG